MLHLHHRASGCVCVHVVAQGIDGRTGFCPCVATGKHDSIADLTVNAPTVRDSLRTIVDYLKIDDTGGVVSLGVERGLALLRWSVVEPNVEAAEHINDAAIAIAAGHQILQTLYQQCIKHGVHYVLAGSIRDDGPLPEVITDVVEAQKAMRANLGGVTIALMMGTMLMPSFLGMIPSFLIMDFLNWIDEPRALYLPGAAPAMGIFLMRQYIMSAIPRELVEAARMDSCGEFQIFWHIIVPLLGPVFGTLGLISFISSWNNFIGPLIVMRSVEKYTFPLALRSVQSPVDTEWGALMVGSAIAVVPLLIIFIFSSKRLIAGLTAGAVKS